MNLVELYNQHLKETDELGKLVGDKVFLFYGACNNQFKLNHMIWEAVEDPDDGYRSYLGSVERRQSTEIFFRVPIARIKVVSVDNGEYGEGNSFSGWRLVDADDGHIWLEIGTDYSDDYYPCYVFSYHPKNPSQEEEQLFPS